MSSHLLYILDPNARIPLLLPNKPNKAPGPLVGESRGTSGTTTSQCFEATMIYFRSSTKPNYGFDTITCWGVRGSTMTNNESTL
ncbi:hypothetical protein A2U01_0050412 [Trifolium medium]|uniref:Uncharacterized protein n=1 Tax=Trifolium medium TaxID=97028 RepID=A0A392QXW3_9FABA|nr:hypothetical protein [Trifolium medium]